MRSRRHSHRIAYLRRRYTPHPFSLASNRTSVDDFLTPEEVVSKVSKTLPARVCRLLAADRSPGGDAARHVEQSLDDAIEAGMSSDEWERAVAFLALVFRLARIAARYSAGLAVDMTVASLAKRLRQENTAVIAHALCALSEGVVYDTDLLTEFEDRDETGVTDADDGESGLNVDEADRQDVPKRQVDWRSAGPAGRFGEQSHQVLRLWYKGKTADEVVALLRDELGFQDTHFQLHFALVQFLKSYGLYVGPVVFRNKGGQLQRRF